MDDDAQPRRDPLPVEGNVRTSGAPADDLRRSLKDIIRQQRTILRCLKFAREPWAQAFPELHDAALRADQVWSSVEEAVAIQFARRLGLRPRRRESGQELELALDRVRDGACTVSSAVAKVDPRPCDDVPLFVQLGSGRRASTSALRDAINAAAIGPGEGEPACEVATRDFCDAAWESLIRFLRGAAAHTVIDGGATLFLDGDEDDADLRRDVSGDMVGRAPVWLRARRQVRASAGQAATWPANRGMPPALLLLGETGTGKELLAEEAYLVFKRAGCKGELVRVNCAELSPELAASDLFGHVKGAFTGAIESRPGKLELADGGVVFLDEIHRLPRVVQGMLLRFLEKGEIRKVGGSDERTRVRVFVVAATNRDPDSPSRPDGFDLADDLRQRLASPLVRVPSLRERGHEDIDLLVAKFEADCDVPAGTLFTHAERAVLGSYEWPGNVRDLRNRVRERAAAWKVRRERCSLCGIRGHRHSRPVQVGGDEPPVQANGLPEHMGAIYVTQERLAEAVIHARTLMDVPLPYPEIARHLGLGGERPDQQLRTLVRDRRASTRPRGINGPPSKKHIRKLAAAVPCDTCRQLLETRLRKGGASLRQERES